MSSLWEYANPSLKAGLIGVGMTNIIQNFGHGQMITKSGLVLGDLWWAKSNLVEWIPWPNYLCNQRNLRLIFFVSCCLRG